MSAVCGYVYTHASGFKEVCGLARDHEKVGLHHGRWSEQPRPLQAQAAAIHREHCEKLVALQSSHGPSDVAGYGLYDCQRYALAARLRASDAPVIDDFIEDVTPDMRRGWEAAVRAILKVDPEVTDG